MDAALALAATRVPELAQLSEAARSDLRLALLEIVPANARESVTSVLTWQSGESVGRMMARASWALVVVTLALVIATAGLIVATLATIRP